MYVCEMSSPFHSVIKATVTLAAGWPIVDPVWRS
jgi:hypothetical protein